VSVPPVEIQEAHELGQALVIARRLIEQSWSERDQAVAKERNIRGEFQVLFESSPDGVIVVDANGRISLLNAAAEILFGYARSELVGASIDMLVPERRREEHASFRKSFMRAPEARPMGENRELFAQRKDGTEFPVEIGLSPIKNVGHGDRGRYIGSQARRAAPCRCAWRTR
jgi:PAS domain S-box-containing protein